jgi:flagellar hook-length control protein FliK
LVRSIRANIGRHQSTARLQLNPPELGRIRIDVRLVEQRMELQIRTQTRDAQETLAARLDGLRHALGQQGILVERIDLASGSEAFADPPTAGEQGESRSNNPQDVAGRGPADRRSRPADDPDEGPDAVPPDLAERVMIGAASEMRLDIRV